MSHKQILFHSAAREKVLRGATALGAVQAAEWLVKSGLTGPVTFDDFLDRRTG